MTPLIRRFDEVDNLISGTLLYRYLGTDVFQAYVDPVKGLVPGLTEVTVDQEPISTTIIARISGSTFQCIWSPGTISAEACAEDGWVIQRETVARRLFPGLVAYQYKRPT